MTAERVSGAIASSEDASLFWGLGFRVEDSGTRVEGLVFRGEGLGCTGHCLDDDNRKQGLGLRVEG